MKRSTYVSKRLFIFMLMIIIGSLAAGCKSCKKEEKEEAKDDKGENDSDVIITDAMLASVEAAINDSGKGPRYNFLLDVLKNLKEKKSVDINATDTDGNTALIYAARVENADIAKVLIKKGADINKKNDFGDPALIVAVSYVNIQVIQVLLATPGIDVNATEKAGRTALYIAAEWAHKDIVLLLLNTPVLNAPGIEINKAYDDGGTLRTAMSIATTSKTAYSSSNPAEAAIYGEIIEELKKQGGTL